MKIKHATNDPQSMAQDGDSILKSLQNQNLPIIDLIVRESIQNSLDATLPKAEETHFDLNLESFKTSDLSPHLEGISDKLEEMYAGEWKYLSFSDRNTSGLTGAYDSSDHKELKKSNYQKLIFDIGKNQEQEGAGGSWGLGKTSYFRSGIGIVFYYTRIKTQEGYEERLIGSLIESPKADKRLLEGNPRGIAWWGRYGSDANRLLPIIDEKEISGFLDIFSLEKYKNEETGTMIIIPYFNAQPEINVTEEKKYYWETDNVKALKYAVQRWYIPRLLNKKYREVTGNSWLRCTVNSELIVPFINTEDTFNIYRELYDAALTGEVGMNSSVDIKIESIRFPRMITDKSNELAGRVAFCEVSRENLKMPPPDNKLSGLSYLGVKDSILLDSFNSKVIAFTRKPGMIVRYSIDDDWLPKSSVQQDDRLLFAFYVPVSNVRLHNKLQELNFETMESYLRSIENADHAYWDDKQGINIVNRTKTEITRVVQNTYQKEEKSKDGDMTASLARKYGQLFVPLRQGRSSTGKRKTPSGTPKSTMSSRRAFLEVTSTQNIAAGDLILRANVTLPKNSKNVIILKIDSQDKKIDLDQWEKMMGSESKYPFAIKDVVISEQTMVEKDFNEHRIILTSNFNETKIIELAVRFSFESDSYLPLLSIKTNSQSLE